MGHHQTLRAIQSQQPSRPLCYAPEGWEEEAECSQSLGPLFWLLSTHCSFFIPFAPF